MIKLYVFLLFAFLTVQIKPNRIKNPRGLVDDAKAQLEEFDSIIKGNIMEAQDDLSDADINFQNFCYDTMIRGETLIQQQEESIDEQLSVVKELANTANVDVSYCTNVREDLLNTLPDEFIRELKDCVLTFNSEMTILVRDSKYVIDVSYSKVDHLRYQFGQCKEDLLCLSPLITEMELYLVSLPQDIKIEVNRLTKLLSDIRISAGDCTGKYVSSYVGNAEAVLSEITACVNELVD